MPLMQKQIENQIEMILKWELTQHESLDDYELGWRLKNENIKLNTNVYYMDYKNQLVLTGAINDVGAPIRATSGSSYQIRFRN